MSWFRRKTVVQQIDLTPESFQRWLRAHRPPWQWFLSLSDGDQEILAEIGDNYSIDIAIGTGYATQDPSTTHMALDAARNPESEEALVRKMAMQLVEKTVGAAVQETVRPARPTMGGVTERREQRKREEQLKRDRGLSFLGRPPDSILGGDA